MDSSSVMVLVNEILLLRAEVEKYKKLLEEKESSPSVSVPKVKNPRRVEAGKRSALLVKERKEAVNKVFNEFLESAQQSWDN